MSTVKSFLTQLLPTRTRQRVLVRQALKLCAKRSLVTLTVACVASCIRIRLASVSLLILELNLNSFSINKEGTSYKKRQHLSKHYVTCDVMLYLRNERSKIRHGRWTVTVRPQHETGLKPTKSNKRQPKTKIYSIYDRYALTVMIFLYCTPTQTHEICNLHFHSIFFK